MHLTPEVLHLVWIKTQGHSTVRLLEHVVQAVEDRPVTTGQLLDFAMSQLCESKRYRNSGLAPLFHALGIQLVV